MIEVIRLRTHVPSDLVNLVSPEGTIFGHNNSSLELPTYCLYVISFETIINEGETVLNGEELRNVIDNKIEPFLVDP